MLNHQQVEKWSATRSQGRSNFIWKYGVAFWGLTTGVIWAFVMSYLQGWGTLAVFLPLALVFFPVGGYFYGVWLWNHMENNYRHATANSPQS